MAGSEGSEGALGRSPPRPQETWMQTEEASKKTKKTIPPNISPHARLVPEPVLGMAFAGGVTRRLTNDYLHASSNNGPVTFALLMKPPAHGLIL